MAKLLTNLKTRLKSILTAQPVPCWTDYLRETSHRS